MSKDNDFVFHRDLMEKYSSDKDWNPLWVIKSIKVIAKMIKNALYTAIKYSKLGEHPEIFAKLAIDAYYFNEIMESVMEVYGQEATIKIIDSLEGPPELKTRLIEKLQRE